MQNLHCVITRLSSKALSAAIPARNGIEAYQLAASRLFSAMSGGGGGGNHDEGEWGKPAAGLFGDSPSDNLGWDTSSSWSTGIFKEQSDWGVADHPSNVNKSQSRAMASRQEDKDDGLLKEFKEEMQRGKKFVDGWGSRFQETCELVNQVREPGARGSYLKDSEKAEICRLHKENPEVYTIEKLAKDYGIMRQRVHAILFLNELEEEKKKLGRPLDQCIEKLLDNFPEFFQLHDQEFHVASLSHKPDFKVMPEDWDGTTKDLDEVHFEISQKEDEVLYQEFLQKLNFIKKKVAGEVYSHRYSRRRPSDGWKFTVEKLGPRGKRGGGGGWKFVTLPDGSSRPLNEVEKMFLKRETPRPRHRILAPYRGS